MTKTELLRAARLETVRARVDVQTVLVGCGHEPTRISLRQALRSLLNAEDELGTALELYGELGD